MAEKDFLYLNIPGLLDRKAWIKLPGEPGGPLLDHAWSERNERQLRALIDFFQRNGLLKEGVIERAIDVAQLELRYSDFTDEGQRFIMTDAPGKWRASLERDRSTSDTDVSFLTRKLKALHRSENGGGDN